MFLAPPTSVIKLWLENHIFTFSTSCLKQPAGGASYSVRGLLKPRPIYLVQIMVLHTNSPWACLIKVCSNGGATYIISEIIAKNILNIDNLIQNL